MNNAFISNSEQLLYSYTHVTSKLVQKQHSTYKAACLWENKDFQRIQLRLRVKLFLYYVCVGSCVVEVKKLFRTYNSGHM